MREVDDHNKPLMRMRVLALEIRDRDQAIARLFQTFAQPKLIRATVKTWRDVYRVDRVVRWTNTADVTLYGVKRLATGVWGKRIVTIGKLSEVEFCE